MEKINISNVILENKVNNSKVILEDSKIWKKNSRMWGDKMHRICSYVAMFPPTLANYFIENYSEKGDIVLDTFSGRGTTLLESRIFDRETYAIDLNPFAYILSKAKSQSFNSNQVLNRLKNWENEFNNYKKDLILSDDLKIYYSDVNLKQLTYIQQLYGKNWKILDDIDNFILAIILGLMHGPAKKDGTSIYFSLHMSNCISMSKNYVQNYAFKKGLVKPNDNIFQKIEDRIKYILKSAKYIKRKAKVFYGSSLNIKEYFDIKPKLIFTSPPYLNIINYTQQNWIKMWLLGYETREQNKNIGLDDKHSLNEYILFMKQYLLSIQEIMNLNSTLAIVIGDVQKTDKIISFEDMWNEKLKCDIGNLNLEEIYTDPISQNKKATNSMGKKAGKSTRVDKIYIFKKKQ